MATLLPFHRKVLLGLLVSTRGGKANRKPNGNKYFSSSLRNETKLLIVISVPNYISRVILKKTRTA